MGHCGAGANHNRDILEIHIWGYLITGGQKFKMVTMGYINYLGYLVNRVLV